jgi:hypothetical protein
MVCVCTKNQSKVKHTSRCAMCQEVRDLTTLHFKLLMCLRCHTNKCVRIVIITITPIEYAEIIHRTVKHYNESVVLIEINDIGEQVSDLLHYDFEYENILYTESAGRSGKRISSGFGKNVDKGIRTTKTVKAVGCSILKLLLEQDQLILNDFNTIQELSTFSRKGASYEAESGCHDDLVMCLVLFAWVSDQQYFKEMTDINTLRKLRQRNRRGNDGRFASIWFPR